MSSATTMDNRRDFYRIEDRGLVDYRLYDEKAPSLESFFKHPAFFEMMNEMQALDIEFTHLLGHMPDHERNLSAIAKILNKKIDMLARTVALVESNYEQDSVQTLDLSEGGMSFSTREALKPGQRMALKLTVVSAYISIACHAEVISSDAENNSADQKPGEFWRVRVNFVDLGEHQRQILARHILRVQQHARREALSKA